jgi:hypothetical protein
MRGAIPPLPQYDCMAWCLVKHRDNFIFALCIQYYKLDYFLYLWNRKIKIKIFVLLHFWFRFTIYNEILSRLSFEHSVAIIRGSGRFSWKQTPYPLSFTSLTSCLPCCSIKNKILNTRLLSSLYQILKLQFWNVLPKLNPFTLHNFVPT